MTLWRSVLAVFALTLISSGFQTPPQEQILSDRQLRQQVSFELARLRNARAQLDTAIIRATRVYNSLHARITRDSIAAIFPEPDSITLEPRDLTMPVGATHQFCTLAWYGDDNVNSCIPGDSLVTPTHVIRFQVN